MCHKTVPRGVRRQNFERMLRGQLETAARGKEEHNQPLQNLGAHNRTSELFFVEGQGEENLEQAIAALRPGLIVCSSSGNSMGPAQRLRAEAERDVQVCCLREDVLERVDAVVVPASNGTHVTLTRAALFDNMAAQPDGRYACVAMVRNRTSAAAAAPSDESSGGVTVVGTVLPACADGWRCNYAVANDKCTSVCRCPFGMHAIEGIWRCSDSSGPSKVELEVLDEFGSHYEDGDRVLVVSRDTLILRYRYGVSSDATLLEQVSGEEPWRRTVSLSSKSAVQRHEGSLVLWEVTRPLAVFVQVTLHSRPPLTKSVMLNLVVVPRLAVGMPCHEDGDCRGVNGLCMERQCQCSFALDANGTCIVVGCGKNDDCARNPGTICVDSTCRCPTGSDLRNGRCWHRACKSHFQCSHERRHTVCFRSSCQCAHGFRDVDGTCMPIECSHDVECRDPLMRCRNASCECSERYVDNGERCTPGHKQCDGLKNCPESKALCTAGNCSCPEGFAPAGNRCVRVSAGPKKCLTSDDCKWSELCVNRPCVCRREPFSLSGVCLEYGAGPGARSLTAGYDSWKYPILQGGGGEEKSRRNKYGLCTLTDWTAEQRYRLREPVLPGCTLTNEKSLPANARR
ncbi:uncharacterized protein [Dermacentor albipictus]|uniref:uncharacterized protein isoform X3 n=1 Tax=Dermacentor albipictus TaxID=60249 RepID=UPI0031FCE199